ncbi:Glutamate/phenylalanine/leucine/valine dehydrogenase, partial [Ochromonadaceae sp. CCMP2298]
GDIGVGGREIGFLFGQYKRIRDEFVGVLTGKGREYGGSLIRPEATGYGCVYFSQEMLRHRGDNLKGKNCLVSGSGNVAQYAIEKLIQSGAKVLTVSDSAGSIYDKNGIDEEKLAFIMDLKNVKRGRIKEYVDKYPEAEFREGVTPWDVKCDLAYPCATQNELPLEDAKVLVQNGCIGVYEGANMPTTADAIELFKEKKMMFSPGKASNAGGVATSGLEMSQNSIRMSWTRDEVDEKLHAIMKDIHENCVKYGQESDDYVDYVKGANIAGFVKVADAMLAQGCV